MYSALYVAECQEKRLLIWRQTMAESNLTVKNFSYWAPDFTKELPTRSWAGRTVALPQIRFPGNYRSFSQNGKFVLEIRRRSGYDQSLPVRRPARNGAIPPNCVPEKQDFKNQIFPMLLGERRCNLAFSRRIFLRHGVLAAVACASNPLTSFGARRPPIAGNEEGGAQRTPQTGSDNWQDHAAALDHLDRTAFSGAVGTNFKVFTATSQLPVWVTL